MQKITRDTGCTRLAEDCTSLCGNGHTNQKLQPALLNIVDLHQLLKREQSFNYRMSSTVIKRIKFLGKLYSLINAVCYITISEMITVASSNVINSMKIMTYTVSLIKFHSASFLKCLNVL
jgi:hypothetical protein